MQGDAKQQQAKKDELIVELYRNYAVSSRNFYLLMIQRSDFQFSNKFEKYRPPQQLSPNILECVTTYIPTVKNEF